MATPPRNLLRHSARSVRCGLLTLAMLTLATAAPAASGDPNEILSEYWALRLDIDEQVIYARRLDQSTEHPWLRREGFPDPAAPGRWSWIHLDPTSRLLAIWTGYEQRSILMDVRTGKTRILDARFNPATIQLSPNEEWLVAQGRPNPAPRYGSLVPHLFRWTNPDLIADGDPDFDRIIRDNFSPWQGFSTLFVGNEEIVVAGTLVDADPSMRPRLLRISIEDQSGIATIPLPGSCRVITAAHPDVWCADGYRLHRLSTVSGELTATHSLTSGPEYRPMNWLTPIGDDLVGFKDYPATIVRIDRFTGSVLESTPFDDVRRIDNLILPQPPMVAFLEEYHIDGYPKATTMIDLGSMTVLDVVVPEPNEIDPVAYGRLGNDWAEAAPVFPTMTPTATPTSTATRKPTPTPCGFSEVALTLHPETARPGETVELRVDVGNVSGCLEGFAASFAPRGGVRLETGGRVSHPCTSPGNEDPELFSSFATDCDSAGRLCTSGTSLLQAGYSDTYDRVFPMPASFSIRCRATVPLDAAPADGRIAVTLVEFDRHGRRPAVHRSVPLRVAGEAFTPTPTATATPTRTATPAPTRPPAPTPCADCPALLLQPIHAARGGIAVVDVRLHSAGRRIVALQTDLSLPAGIAARGATAWRCRGNPFLRQRASFRLLDCDGDACRSVRALLYDLEPGLPPLPDGMTLFTCRVAVAPDAAAGIGELVAAKAIGSDAAGRQIPLAASPALVSIRLAPTPPQGSASAARRSFISRNR